MREASERTAEKIASMRLQDVATEISRAGSTKAMADEMTNMLPDHRRRHGTPT